MVTITDKPPQAPRRRRRQGRRSEATERARSASVRRCRRCACGTRDRSAAARRGIARRRHRRLRRATMSRRPRPRPSRRPARPRPSHQRRHAAAAGRRRRRRGRAEEIGDFDQPSTSPSRPGRRRPLRRRAVRADPAGPADGGEPEALPRHLATRSPAAASRACSRSPSPPTTRSRACSTPTSPTPRATRGSSSTGARSDRRDADPAAPASCCAIDDFAAEPQRRPAAVRPRRRALRRHRRRRRGGRPGAQRPGPRRACSASSCAIDPDGEPTAGTYRGRRRYPACATRGASRSTARPATSGSATSARTSSRRSTRRRRRARPGAQLRLVGVRGHRAASTTTRRRPARVPPVLAYGHDERLLGHRRLRRPRPRPADRSTAATSTATSAQGELRSFTADPARRGDRRPRARPRGAVAELVRRGRATATSTRPRSRARSTGWWPTSGRERRMFAGGPRSLRGARPRGDRSALAAGAVPRRRARSGRRALGLGAAPDRALRAADLRHPGAGRAATVYVVEQAGDRASR